VLSRPTYIAARIALAKHILANPGDLAARSAYFELKRVYLAGVMPMSEDTRVWREGLPSMVRPQV
jgi:hypothetical protein